MKVVLFFLTLAISISVFALKNNSQGSCGSLGCAAKETFKADLFIAILANRQVKASIGDSQSLQIVRSNSRSIEKYNLIIDSKTILCATVEYAEMPVTVDGLSTVQVGNRNVLISVGPGSCR